MVTTPSGFLHQEMKQYRGDLRRLANPLSIANYTYRLRQNPAPRMVWLRAFHSMYNPAQAASVLQNLLSDAPHAHLEMIGPDKGDGSLSAFQNLVRELHLGDAIQVSGVVPKAAVPVRLNEADIFLNTTDVDNAPVSVTEAMASGLCIVSTDVGGLPYLLEHEQTALLVPPRDAAAMTNAIRRLLDEPGLAETLSRNARARAETFSWDALLPQWEEILSLAIGSASSRVTLVGVAGAGSSASSSR
jgi:glycosyltransferase involved in cell wall biosynthesis